MKNFFIISAFAALTALFSCGKDVPIDCACSITPLVQLTDGGETEPLADVVAYAFYADSVFWRVGGYTNALEGKLVAKSGGATISANMTAIPGEDGVIRFPSSLTMSPTIIVVCDTSAPTYGWRQTEVPAGLTELDLGITFRSWKTPSIYAESRWTMVVEAAPDI